MTPLELVEDLSEKIREAVKKFEFIAEYQHNKHVSVYEQYLPLAAFEDDSFYPAVTVQLYDVSSDGIDDIATVVLTCGVFGGDGEDGWRDLFNLAELVRQEILTTPVLAEKFPVVMPVEFVPNEGQPQPFFFADINVRYRISTPRN